MKYFFILFTLLLTEFTFAQTDPETKFINENFKNGEQAMLERKYRVALQSFQKVLKIKPRFIPALRASGTCYELLGDHEKALSSYFNVLSQDPYFSRLLYYDIGRTYYRLGQYHNALDYFSQFIGLQKLDNQHFGLAVERELPQEQEYLQDIYQNILACQISIDSIQYLNIMEVINIGPAINTKSDEYFPFVANDNSLLFCTRRKGEERDEDLFVSVASQSHWQTASPVAGFNSGNNEGMGTFVRNGRQMYFTACEREKVMGTCDIWEAKVEGKKVTKVSVPDGINSDKWESQACISCDGNIIYFASNREGGMGGTDIWRCKKLASGAWSEPENLGPSINTAQDEEAPFITNDGKMLYFSSTGHFGLGEEDIYFSRLQNNGFWSKARNLGQPVNTASRELGFFLSADGKTGYFASDRKGGYGGMDIYKFELSAQLAADPITFVEGVVIDADFRLPVVTTIKIPNRNPIQTDERGRFFICFPANQNLDVQVNHTGFRPYQNTFEIPFWENHNVFDITIQLRTPVKSLDSIEEKDVDSLKNNLITPPKPIVQPLIFTHGLYYGMNESELSSKHKNELDDFFKKVTTHVISKIEIIGFADYVGSDADNMKLSEERAKKVATFIKERELKVDNIYIDGQGEIGEEQDAEESRRVEIIIHATPK